MPLIIGRILARYLSGALVAYGLIPHDIGQELAMDPDIAFALGTGIGVVTEAVYAFARKHGWAT